MFTPSGAQIIRHETAAAETSASEASVAHMDAIIGHVERHIGQVANVFHETVSPHVHIDILHVLPTSTRPCQVLVTCGMSSKPMNAPEGAEEARYAELLIGLDPHWPITQDALRDPRFEWPITWLKQLARLPHEYNTWLWDGHTVPNGDPPEPFGPNTKQCCWLLLPPVIAPEDFHRLTLSPEVTIHFFGATALYAEEVTLKLNKGTDVLLPKLLQNGGCEALLLDRPNVGKRKLFGR
jgi:hypothetical protein